MSSVGLWKKAIIEFNQSGNMVVIAYGYCAFVLKAIVAFVNYDVIFVNLYRQIVSMYCSFKGAMFRL